MNDERIKGALRDATDTHDVMIGAGVLSSAGDLFEQSFGDRPADPVREVLEHREAR